MVGFLPRVGVARLLGAAASSLLFVSSTSAQSFPGCSSADMRQLTFVGRGLMGCFSLSLSEVFMFMGGMSADQDAWLERCSQSSEDYQSECFQLLESFLQQAASQPGSLPAKVVSNVYKNPPQVLDCVAQINNQVETFSPTCKDGAMLGQITRASARLAPYIDSIQPWRLPPQIQGCAVNDLLNLQLAYLPFIDCLNFNFTQLAEGFTTSSGPGMGAQLEDATIRAGISCLYDPHMSNADCMYLVVVASTKLQGGSWSDMGVYAMRALTDYPQACQCVRGASQSAAFSAVATSCPAHDTLNFLTALEASCAFEPQIQSSLSKALNGCSDADVVRTELVGLQVLDCMEANGGDLAGSTDVLTEARVAQIANCVNKPGYDNAECLGLLGSLARIAADEPDSLEAQVVEKMTKDGAAFCGCLDRAARSPPAKDLSPTCEVPYSGIKFLQDNKKYCEAIAAVPPSFWTAAAAGIAAAAKAPLSSETVPKAGEKPTETPVTEEVELGPTGPKHLPQKSDSGFWDHLPAFSSASFMSQSSESDEGGKDVETGRRLEHGGDDKLRLVGGAKAELVGEHPHLRFKGNTQKQKEA
ncbi:hypothetical protein VYU27_000349 [Nannochloropsis oceanica]